MTRQKRENIASAIPYPCSRETAEKSYTFNRFLFFFLPVSVCFPGFIPTKAAAQEVIDSLHKKDHELAGIVVTAGRTPVEARKSTRIVTTITKNEIERLPLQNINDLFRFSPGVDLRQRGPFGVQADLSVRGGTYDQALILLNGVNITDPQTGHHSLNIPVDIESIERIEMLNGPAAGSFGPNAFSGAVNIITGNSLKNHIRASVMTGQYGLLKTSANISNTVRNFEHFLSISRVSSSGYSHNTGFVNTNFFYQAKQNLKAGTIDLQAGYNLKDFGANSFYSLKYPDQYEATRTGFASLRFQTNSKIVFEPVLYIRRNSDRFELVKNDDSVPFNHHLTTTAGMNLNLWTNHRLGKTAIGADLRNENIISNVLGNLLNEPVKIHGYDSAFYSRHYARLNTTLYAEHTFTAKIITAAIGLMAHYNSDLGRFSICPGINLSIMVNDRFRLYSSANKALRMPTFTDMFYKSPVQQGNPHLAPEEAVTLEAGIKYNDQVFKGYVSMFRRIGSDMIDWIKDPSPDSVIWRSMNHSEISSSGLECSLAITPPPGSSFEKISSVQVSYAWLQAGRVQDNMLSKYVLDYLNHQLKCSITMKIARKLSASGIVTYNDRNGTFQDVTGAVTSYSPFWLADSKITWKDRRFSLFAEASNILNRKYYDLGGIVQPGIWFRMGITGDFDYGKDNLPEKRKQIIRKNTLN